MMPIFSSDHASERVLGMRSPYERNA